MNERLKDTLYRWLPKLAILSVLVMLSSYLFAEYYVRPRFRHCGKGQKGRARQIAPEPSGGKAGKGRQSQSRLRADRGSHRYTRRQQTDPKSPERSGGPRRNYRGGMGDQCSRPHCVLWPASSPGTQRRRCSSQSPNRNIGYGPRRCAFTHTADRHPVTCGNKEGL